MVSTSQAVYGEERRVGNATEWDGGRLPLGIGNVKLGMWLFLGSDALTFAGFLAGYWAIRLSSPNWPAVEEVFHGLGLVTAMTFILFCSSATIAVAVGAAKQGDRSRAVRFLMLTIVGGLIFLVAQAFEWTELIRTGAGLVENPWGTPMFSAFFFMVTGFHGFHVLAGISYLLIVTVRARRGTYSPVGIEVAGLYWHFVDLVWVFIFTLFYLI